MEKLKGQVAVVTGAGRGIGKAIALAYAGEGAAVCCAARTTKEIEQDCWRNRVLSEAEGWPCKRMLPTWVPLSACSRPLTIL